MSSKKPASRAGCCTAAAPVGGRRQRRSIAERPLLRSVPGAPGPIGRYVCALALALVATRGAVTRARQLATSGPVATIPRREAGRRCRDVVGADCVRCRHDSKRGGDGDADGDGYCRADVPGRTAGSPVPARTGLGDGSGKERAGSDRRVDTHRRSWSLCPRPSPGFVRSRRAHAERISALHAGKRGCEGRSPHPCAALLRHRYSLILRTSRANYGSLYACRRLSSREPAYTIPFAMIGAVGAPLTVVCHTGVHTTGLPAQPLVPVAS